MHLVSISLPADTAVDDVDCIGVGCEPVEAMAHGLGDEQTSSGVLAEVPSMDVKEDLVSFLCQHAALEDA
jgi:hypothetical protein